MLFIHTFRDRPKRLVSSGQATDTRDGAIVPLDLLTGEGGCTPVNLSVLSGFRQRQKGELQPRGARSACRRLTEGGPT